MALESAPVFEKKDLESIVGRSISLDPKKTYRKGDKDDRKYFVDIMDDYSDLTKYYAALRQDNGDIDAIDDIAGLLSPGNPDLIRNRDATGILSATKKELSEAIDNLANYSRENSFHKELDENELLQLVLELGNPDKFGNCFLYMIDGDKEHNRLVDLVKKYAAVQSHNTEFINRELSKLMNPKNLPAWHQSMFNRYIGDPSYVNELNQSYAGVVSVIFEREFMKIVGKGKERRKEPGKDKLYKFFKKGLDAAEDKLKDEPNVHKKNDIWDKDLKNVYRVIGEVFYRGEKYYKEEDEWDKEDDRKKERREMGMRK